MEDNDKLALHAIIIKKIIPIEEAKEIAQEFINDKKKHFYRETVKSYRFRNIPKTHFMPKCYKTKKINKNVSIIIGKLKPEHEHLEGSGLFDFIKKTGSNIKSAVSNTINKVSNIFKPRLDSYNNTSRKTIEQYGNLPINSLMICRTPIMKVLDKALNFLSLGKFSELKKKYGFDELYHLQLVANVGDKNIVLEKNEVINVNTSFKNDSKTQTQQIRINPPPLTINEILEKGRERVGDHLWFSYDAFKNNCQYFIKYCLEGVNLYDESAKNFLFQDIEELAKEMPQYVKTTANALTTTGAITNKLMGKAKYNDKMYDQITGHILNYNEEPYIPKYKNYASQEEIKRMSKPDKNFDINAPLPPPIIGGIRKRYTPVIDARHHIGTTPDDEFKNLLKSYTIKRLLEIIQFNNFSNYAHLNKPQLINVIHNHFLLKDGQIMRKMESSFHTDETKTAYREGYIEERDKREKS